MILRRTMTVATRAAILGTALLASSALSAQTPRVLLAGDSWVEAMWNGRSMRNALADRGMFDVGVLGGRTALGGTTASAWAQNALQSRLTQELEENPTVDIVHLSVGGNDLIAFFNGRQTQAEIDEFLADVTRDIEAVVDHIHSVRPSALVVLVEYTFLPGLLGQATRSQQSAFFTQFGRARLELARRKPGLQYVLNFGLMQHEFGVPPDIAPGVLPAPGDPPDYDPFPGGDPNRPAPGSAFVDPIHLTDAGYVILADRAIDTFYARRLRPPEVPASGPLSLLTLLALTFGAGGVILRRRSSVDPNVVQQ